MKHFTPEEDQFLRDNYLTIPAKRMSKMLGRTEGAARQRMQRLNVMMPPEFRKKLQEESRYQKGHTPCNKGKKQTEYMSREMIEKTIATRFKKGHKPHNTIDKNGTIRIRTDKRTGLKYQYIKIADANWQLLHRVMFEKKHGIIPKGMMVVFKDGNQMNCDIENQELITMKENMARNTIQRYPVAVKSAIRTLTKLKKQIKQTA